MNQGILPVRKAIHAVMTGPSQLLVLRTLCSRGLSAMWLTPFTIRYFLGFEFPNVYAPIG